MQLFGHPFQGGTPRRGLDADLVRRRVEQEQDYIGKFTDVDSGFRGGQSSSSPAAGRSFLGQAQAFDASFDQGRLQNPSPAPRVSKSVRRFP